ncbi:MAG: ABC transporter permease [Allomuricauda sp.]
MRTVRFLLYKEFKQIFRNRSIVALIMVMPVMQLLILPWTANYEVKNINVAVVDQDYSTYSQHLQSKISGSNYFNLVSSSNSYDAAYEQIESGAADLILEIPPHFKKDLNKNRFQKLFIAVNAINGTKANLGAAYLQQLIKDYDQDLQIELNTTNRPQAPKKAEITFSNWYNSDLNYKVFMVPGILAILVTMVGGFLSALNIVKEKEVGTIEQINVTPIKKHHFILGKLIPFWILGNVVFTLGLLISWLVYGIVPMGNIFLLYLFIAIYLLAVLGFGLLISTYSETQQQAMFIMFFFMMAFILMGGLFTPIESMPKWAQMLTKLNLVSYLIDVVRMVILKGSGFLDVLPKLLTISFFAVGLNTWAILNYKKTS